MKADSTMMLLDTIAVPSRMFESLLVFFRNNKLDIEDRESFDNIIQKYVGYVSDDIERFAKGEQLEQMHKDLEENIKKYLGQLKEQYKDEIKTQALRYCQCCTAKEKAGILYCQCKYRYKYQYK